MKKIIHNKKEYWKVVLVTIAGAFVLTLISCVVPNSKLGVSAVPTENIQLKVRVIGSSAPGGPPSFTQQNGASYPNEIDYVWYNAEWEYASDSSENHVKILEGTGRREGFTHNGGRDLFLDYYTTERMIVPYSGIGTTRHPVYVWINRGALLFGRGRVNFYIPAGLDPKKDLAVFTLYIKHDMVELIPGVSVTEITFSSVYEGTEPKTTTQP